MAKWAQRRRGRGRAATGVRGALAATFAVILLMAGISSADAQSGAPAAPAPRPQVAPLSTAPPDLDRARQEAADERVAALLLSEAREELEMGQLRNARRRLEILVTRFASTSFSARARRLLEQLALIDGVPVPPIPKSAAPTEPARGRDAGPGQMAARPPGASLIESDFSASGGDRLFFADGSDDAGGRGRRLLREKAAWLQRYPQVFMRIEGYADDSGSDEANSALAMRRAEAVRDVLVEAGVAPTRMHITVYGRENPLATCPAPECAAQNRRVVLVLTDARGTRLAPPQPATNAALPPSPPGRERAAPPGRRDR